MTNTAPIFVIKRSSVQDAYFRFKDNMILWVDKEFANKYPSKYAAKKHVYTLNGMPKNWLVEKF